MLLIFQESIVFTPRILSTKHTLDDQEEDVQRKMEEMDERWMRSPALRALTPAVIKELQGYQEEADTLYKETQASLTVLTVLTTPPPLLDSLIPGG